MGFSSGGLYKLRTELAEIEMERLREDQDRLRCEDAIKMEKRLSIRLRKEMQEREFALSVERNAYVVVCDLKNPIEKKHYSSRTQIRQCGKKSNVSTGDTEEEDRIHGGKTDRNERKPFVHKSKVTTPRV